MIDAIKKSGGDIRKMEEIFGLKEGQLGTNPTIIGIDNPQNLRIPDGNELGAFDKEYIPGGYTCGNNAEAVIDSVPPGGYQVIKFKDPEVISWMEKRIGE